MHQPWMRVVSPDRRQAHDQIGVCDEPGGEQVDYVFLFKYINNDL